MACALRWLLGVVLLEGAVFANRFDEKSSGRPVPEPSQPDGPAAAGPPSLEATQTAKWQCQGDQPITSVAEYCCQIAGNSLIHVLHCVAVLRFEAASAGGPNVLRAEQHYCGPPGMLGCLGCKMGIATLEQEPAWLKESVFLFSRSELCVEPRLMHALEIQPGGPHILPYKNPLWRNPTWINPTEETTYPLSVDGAGEWSRRYLQDYPGYSTDDDNCQKYSAGLVSAVAWATYKPRQFLVSMALGWFTAGSEGSTVASGVAGEASKGSAASGKAVSASDAQPVRDWASEVQARPDSDGQPASVALDLESAAREGRGLDDARQATLERAAQQATLQALRLQALDWGSDASSDASSDDVQQAIREQDRVPGIDSEQLAVLEHLFGSEATMEMMRQQTLESMGLV